MAGRVLITSVSSFLGSSLAKALEDSTDVSYIAGVDVGEPPAELERTEFIKADIRNPLIRRVLASTEVDTVVHTGVLSTASGLSGRVAQRERNVIGTLQLLAACQRIEGLSKLVVRSSTAVYGIEPGAPSVLPESWSGNSHPEGGYFRDVVEAETYARDFARRRPDVEVTVLRMANVIGPRAESNMTQFFSLPLVPTALGFDPRLQLIHEDDAIEVLKKAVLESHPGVFNAAADGIMYLSQAIRIARRLPLPILSPVARLVGDAFRAAGLVDFPQDQLSLLVHGRVVDNSRLKERFGYVPKYSTPEAFRNFVETRRQTTLGPSPIAQLEKGVYDLLVTAASRASGRPEAPSDAADEVTLP
ncbi:MAG: NAD-dependent epimerase/dehydratase family protein [Actinomycetota bacterium]